MNIICPVIFYACWERYLKREHSRRWLQVYFIVEIKTDVTNALAQLSACLSWIFMEFSLLLLPAALSWHQNSLAGIHRLRFGMVIMLFHHIGPRCSSLHWLTMCLGSSLHSVPFKSQRAYINQWQCYVMIQCPTLQDAKRLWRRATIVMKVMSLEDWKNKNEKVRSLWWHKWHADHPPPFLGLCLCHETIMATTPWTWQWCTSPHEIFAWTGRRCQ